LSGDWEIVSKPAAFAYCTAKERYGDLWLHLSTCDAGASAPENRGCSRRCVAIRPPATASPAWNAGTVSPAEFFSPQNTAAIYGVPW